MTVESDKQVATMNLYCDVMAELKIRQAAMTPAMAGSLPINPRIAYEMCFLQLRMICELIALGCLIVHGDIVATKRANLQKAYKPGVIMTALEKLHPRFFPQPGRQILDAEGKVAAIEDVTDGYLTKAELIKLWTKCGRILHRGNIRDLDRIMMLRGGSFAEIQTYSGKIVNLLNHHQIALHNSTDQIWVLMQAIEDGLVHAMLFRAEHIERAKNYKA